MGITVKNAPSLKLVDIEGKGRGFEAAKPLKGGEIVVQESPILVFSAFPLKSKDSSKYCSHCFRFIPAAGEGCSTTYPCHLCEDVLFCNSNCMSSALSSTHSPWACKALNYLRKNPPLLSEEQQVQARYLVAAYNLAAASPSSFQTLLSLHGDGKRYTDAAKSLHSILSDPGFPASSIKMTSAMTSALLDKETNNSFNLMGSAVGNGERTVRAYGIYPNVSFFNHSCLPNACRFDYLDSGGGAVEGNTDMFVRLTRDVPQGQEICISYVRVNRGYSDRKTRLLDYFGFECFCDRCKVEASNLCVEDRENDDRFFAKILCAKENCGGTLAPLPPSHGNPSHVLECNYCGELRNVQM